MSSRKPKGEHSYRMVRIRADLYKKIEGLARAENRSTTNMINRLLAPTPNTKPHIRSKDFKNELGES